MQTRYLFVIGGVMSGIGKGIATASIARILKDRGLTVAPVKIDPYINVDAGTMNPLEHGEVFVTDDGKECDQDIGNYERFLDETLTGEHSITTGQIYQSVIERERSLGYGGRCVEAVPDIPNEVLRRLSSIAKHRKANVVLIEIGGTVGEYQNALYLEAARLLRLARPQHVAVLLVSYLPVPSALREMKTKPTQQAVRMLQEAGVQPDIILARGAAPLDAPRRRKLATFCNVQEKDIISSPDTPNLYDVPEVLEREHFGDRLAQLLKLPKKRSGAKLSPQWTQMARRAKRTQKSLRIGIVGKYITTGNFLLRDAYISVLEAISHGALANNVRAQIEWIDAEALEQGPTNLKKLASFHGIIVPGGFGSRGVEGKIRAIQFAREKKIPYLGLCYGMQLAVIEFARNVAKLRGANTTEISAKTPHPVISLLSEQTQTMARKDYGATMRLGAQPCTITPKTQAARAYFNGRSRKSVSERHRHRYEFNNAYRDAFELKGMVVSGTHPTRDLVEIIELPRTKHPFFLGTQFHPEFQSRPLSPHPLFVAFTKAAKQRKTKKHR